MYIKDHYGSEFVLDDKNDFGDLEKEF